MERERDDVEAEVLGRLGPLDAAPPAEVLTDRVLVLAAGLGGTRGDCGCGWP